jgi:glutamate racemase
MDKRPIGIFDSGLGGLTVVKEIIRELPYENLVYFGDNGRYPYGTKSIETILKFTFQNIRFLLELDIKLLVIACNTASSCSLSAVLENFSIPVIEVIKPGSIAALRESKNKNIGVIGTTATIGSKVYEKTIKSLNPDATIFSKACPIFVPIVEEGWWDNEIAYLIAKKYLLELKDNNIDTLLLGCTHYPLLKDIISKVFNDEVHLVSSAFEVARAVKDYINAENIISDPLQKPYYRFYTSDDVNKFASLGSTILQKNIEFIEKVDIEKY